MFKLRTFLILTFTFFVILLCGTLGLIMSTHSMREIKKEIGNSLTGTAYQMSSKLDYFMWSRAEELEWLSTLDTFQHAENSKEIQRMLEQLRTNIPSYSWVGYLDKEGKVLAATDGILVNSNISSRPVYKEGIKGRFIGDVHEAVLLAKYIPNPTGEPLQFVDISLPVKDGDGEIAGVLAAHLSWEWSKEVEQTILKPQQDYSKELELFIVSKTDNSVLLGPKDMIGHPLQLDNIQQAQKGKTGWELVKWPDGKSYLTGYAYSDGYLNYKGLGWTVLVRQPEEVAFDSVKELKQYFLIVGTVAIVLFALIGWFLAEKISRPIRGLTLAADRLRAGETVVIPEYGGFHDISSLAHSLKSMVESLSRSESALGSMKSLAHYDQLTGLPNRVALEDYLEQTLQVMDLSAETLSFMYLDLDGFKKVNDTLGHQVGDLLLQKVAQRLTLVTAAGNISVRLGGDEFLLILRSPKMKAHDEANELALEIISMLNNPFVVEFNQVSIGCSIGVALYPEHGSNPSQIIQLADECLYRSKQAGKNRVTFVDNDTAKQQARA